MKAIQFFKYGSPEEVLQLKEVEKPVPKPNEVLVKIHSTTINDYDWSIVRGKPYLYRLMFGLFKPKSPNLGMELSGTIESTGSDANKFKIGQTVFGDTSDHGFGTLAEYICIHEDALIAKPEHLSFEEATSLPHAATLAFQSLEDIAHLKEGQKVLINGAGGGVGTLGLQIAKQKNCEVSGVDSAEKFDLMQSVGFDHVIDYKTENFTKSGIQYDVILDCKTNKSPFAYAKVLSQNGIYVTVGGDLPKLFKTLFWGKIIALFSSKRLKILGLKANKGLEEFCELFEKEELKFSIDGTYPLKEVPQLIQYFGEGKHKGKIVIKVSD